MATISERIKLLRNEYGLTQEDLANRLGVARATVASWEVGRRTPDADAIKKLANIFNTTADYLIGHTDTRHSTPTKSDDIDLNKLDIAGVRPDMLEEYRELPDEAQILLRELIKDFYNWWFSKKRSED